MTGTSILRAILSRVPDAAVRASIHTTPPEITSDRITYIQGDLRDLETCRAMVRGCDCAIMAAAHAGGAAYTTRSPLEHMRENLVMNRQMLEACHLEGVKRIIFIGSAVIYQSFTGHIREDELDLNRDPHSAYFGFAWAMRFLEKLCVFLHEQQGHDVIMIRAANIFGPRDKFDARRSNFIPAIIRKAADRMDPFEVWGTPDVVRDVIYCDDFAKAVVMLADADAVTCDAFNVGTGIKTTVGDVVQWALRYTGHTPSSVQWIQDKPTTIQYRGLDCAKLKASVGWEPDHTIEQGIQKTAQWWLDNKDVWKR